MYEGLGAIHRLQLFLLRRKKSCQRAAKIRMIEFGKAEQFRRGLSLEIGGKKIAPIGFRQTLRLVPGASLNQKS
jgi:hypothetical protein